MKFTFLHFSMLLLAAVIPLPAWCQADDVFAPQHVAKLKTVTAAVISPDGQHVAYGLSVPRDPLREENGAAWCELHVVDQQGQSRPFVSGQVNVSGVQWTPDGDGIAFTAKRHADDYAAWYVIPLNGGEARRMISHAANIHGVAYSPLGMRVAFLSTLPQSKEQQEFRNRGFHQEIYEEDVPPTRVWLAAADGSDPPRPLEIEGSASFVQWSPDGRTLAVVVAPTPLVDDDLMFRRIVLVDVDSGKVVERIQNPGKLGQVAWSPDGKHLAMISGVDIHDPREGHLMVAAIPGDGSVRDLMPDYQAHVGSFAWQDDERLLWEAAEGCGTALGAVSLKGVVQLVRKSSVPILSSLSLAKDGQMAAFIGETPAHPGEVFLWQPDAELPRRMTNVNPWLENLRFAKQEVIKWTARDGLELEGILIYPLNYQPGRRYPLIMAVHGGPEANCSDGWLTGYNRPGQISATRGFAVFYPNYRGSTGRGVEFSKLGQADAAGKEFDDLVDGVDHLIKIGLVDRDRVGITGGSYGGYASAWAATYYSDRFAASVMFVGISDNISKVGTTDIPEEMFLVHHRKRLWDDWEYFLERSPLHYVQRHRTPILILHGKDDPRVDPSQSKELYRHLKTLDQAPVRLVLYPGEGHGNRRAAARLDYNLRMLQWMEHYLQGPGGDPPPFEIDHAAAMNE